MFATDLRSDRAKRAEVPERDRQTCLADLAEAQLRRSGYPALHALSCRCDRGTATLHGHVHSYYLKQLAQEAVAKIDGVTGVFNHVEVISAAPDQSIHPQPRQRRML